MEEYLANRVRNLESAFRTAFGAAPQIIVRAPGRVNLIGEHTDYNEGFVLPSAIDREMLIAANPRTDENVRAFSAEYNELDEFNLGSIEKSPAHPWCDYLRATLATLQKNGHQIGGFDAVLSGTVPQGAGLSSSAAYEVAVTRLCCQLFKIPLSPKEMALTAQQAENQFIGVQCGIMDQFISALGKKDSALFIDCRSLDFQSVPLNLNQNGLSIVITNSGVRRGLVDSEYNARRNECSEGVALLSGLTGRKLNSLRDTSSEELERFANQLPPVVLQRCRHVVSENERVQQAVSALQSGDIKSFGKLMNASHASLRDDFQVSCPELDKLVELSQAHAGVLGARMTGAGFGGCTVAIMQSSAVDTFKSKVVPAYEAATGRKAEVYVCQAVNGAEVLPLAAIPDR